MFNKTVLSIAIATSFLTLAPTTQAAVLYSVTEIGPFFSHVEMRPTTADGLAINNKGDVVGTSVDPTDHGGSNAFVKLASQDIISNYSDLSLPGRRMFSSSTATGINDYGQIIGSSNTDTTPDDGNSSNEVHAFIANTQKITDLGTLGGQFSEAYGINNKGQVVGLSSNLNEMKHAFITRHNVMKDLGTLGGDSSIAYSINNKGRVVGTAATSAANVNHAFVTTHHCAMKDLGTLGDFSQQSMAYDINDSDQIVGYSTIDGVTNRAFVTVHGVMKDLGTLGGDTSVAYSINNHGQIVGDAETATPLKDAPWLKKTQPFVTLHGVMTDLNTLIDRHSGWILNSARAINNKGQITGVGFTPPTFLHPDGISRPFLLTPIKILTTKY